MTSKQYFTASLINLAILTAGIMIGRFSLVKSVSAQTQPTPVSPTMTVGSLGTNLILAHQIQTDSLVVNGYDIMKLNQNIINYLGAHTLAGTGDLQNLVNDSRASHLYTLKLPNPAAQTPHK